MGPVAAKLIVKSVSFMYENASLSLTLWGDGTAALSSLYSQTRRKGHATGLMQMVTEFADANGLKLMLTAAPYSTDGPNHGQLVAFYERFGFRAPVYVDGTPTFMERLARSQELHSP